MSQPEREAPVVSNADTDFWRLVVFLTAFFLIVGVINGLCSETQAIMFRYAFGNLLAGLIAGLGLSVIFRGYKSPDQETAHRHRRRAGLVMLTLTIGYVFCIVISFVTFSLKIA